jgi:hypothetical protein
MKLLTLLTVVAVGGGGPPAAIRYRTIHHLPPPIFRQATVSVSRYTASGRRLLRTAHGELRLHVRPGRYFIEALANDTPGQTPNHPCGVQGEPRSFEPGHGVNIKIKPGTKHQKVTLECLMK